MTKQMEMNYGELCDFFKEEKKRSGRTRQLQFNRWRKEYNIDKIEGKNRYIVKRKTYKEIKVYNSKRKNAQFATLLTPIIYTTLMNSEENVLDLPILEKQMAFSLVNSKFALSHKVIAEEIGVDVKDLCAFKEAIWKMNNRTMNNVINSMVKKHIIIKSKGLNLDKKDIKSELEKMLLSEEDIQKNLIEINTNNCIKISKSRNKNLLKISKYNLEKMINALIAETEEECKKNYDAIISNMNDLEIYGENPNKIKSKKVIDTESSM